MVLDKTKQQPGKKLPNDGNSWLSYAFWIQATHAPFNSPDGLIDLPDPETLEIPDSEEIQSIAEQGYAIDETYTPYFEDGTAVSGETWDAYLGHLIKREGYRTDVYEDSLGHLTVGVGHLVDNKDGLVKGQQISHEEVHNFLQEDAREAYIAAIEQANELGINDSNFVVALGSVNYQLGTGWRNEFDQTWAMMKDGDLEGAAANLESSKWNGQTPVRVNDFQAALHNASQTQQRSSLTAQNEIETGRPDSKGWSGKLNGLFTASASGISVTEPPEATSRTPHSDEPSTANISNTLG